MATPKFVSRKTNGVTPAQPAAQPSGPAKQARTKSPPAGEKVTIRRLPPGMTEDEFLTLLGAEWAPGNAKVDWLSYWPGKVSQQPSKSSRPSRAQLHVTKRDHLVALSEAVRDAIWEDAKETWNDPVLVGSACLEVAIYKKIPSNKRRSDAKQGSIDQEPEFMAFLERLANPPVAKEQDVTEQADDEAEAKAPEKPITTPLVEYLKEKRANKAKDAAAAKNTKHVKQEPQGAAGKTKVSSSPEETKKRTKEPKTERSAPRESVRILTKKSATAAAVVAARAVASQLQQAAAAAAAEAASSAPSAAPAAPAPKSRRADIAAAARSIQRDLGLSPAVAHRRARQEIAKAEAETKGVQESNSATVTPEPAKAQEPPATPTTATASATSKSRGRRRGGGGGVGAEELAKTKSAKATEASSQQAPLKPPITIMKKKPETSSGTTPNDSPILQSPSSAPSKTAPISAAAPVPAKSGMATKKGPLDTEKVVAAITTMEAPAAAAIPATAAASSSSAAAMTRGFVKHANPSQGVTESLLKEALQGFGGGLVFLEMHRRKGFAYVEFADPEGLAAAIAASPVTVGTQGAAVQVLERKETGSKRAAVVNAKAAAVATTTPAAAAGNGATASQESATVHGPPARQAPEGPAAKNGLGGGDPATGEKQRTGRRRGGRGRDRDRDATVKDASAAGSDSAKKAGGSGAGADATTAKPAAASLPPTEAPA